MNAHTAAEPATLPAALRSEAFAEDVFEFVGRAEPVPEPALRWLVNLAPLAVAVVGVAFAVVPPLV
ncbi:MAG TPA: hypothetical protein VFQ20_03340 [Burkholderiaceae bacterium]|nr:hypothetical protein [Burkholderiaceae bacterium]